MEVVDIIDMIFVLIFLILATIAGFLVTVMFFIEVREWLEKRKLLSASKKRKL